MMKQVKKFFKVVKRNLQWSAIAIYGQYSK